MKTMLTTIGVALSFSVGAYAQGVVKADNTANTGVYGGFGGTAFDGSSTSPTYDALVTQNGLIFTSDTAAQWGNNSGPAGSQLLGVDSSFVLVGGTSSASVASIVTGAGGNIVLSVTGNAITGDNVNWGQLQANAGIGNLVPGVTVSGPAFFNLFVWEGNGFADYASAVAGGDYAGSSGAWTQVVGGPNPPNPANPAPTLTGMGDVLLTATSVPEPTTLALAGLGGFGMLMALRRKQA
jgi:hypothetical protein